MGSITKSAGETVFILDDHTETSAAIEYVLTAHGYRARVYLDPTSLLRDMKVIAPCALLLDYCMPRFHAESFVEEIRRQSIDTIIVLMSATPNIALLAENMGIRHILKPFDLAAFIAMLKNLSLECSNNRQAG